MDLFYIGDTSHTTYKCEKFSDFKNWLSNQKIRSLDIETNVVDSILDRILITVQLSDKTGQSNWVLQWSYLKKNEQEYLLDELKRSDVLYIIVSATFEYTVARKYGIYMENIFDCYRAEQILTTGYTIEKGKHSLKGILKSRFDLDISKAAQLSFGDDILTNEKIIYAATDTVKLGELMEIQLDEMRLIDKKSKLNFHKGLIKTMWWDNQFILCAGDMEYDGVLFDTNKWVENYQLALPLVEEARKKVFEIIKTDYKDQAVEAEFLSLKDRFDSIWGSSKKKLGLLQLIYPDIEKVAKKELKEYLKNNDPNYPEGLPLSGVKWENSDYPYKLDDKYAIIKTILFMDKTNQEGYISGLNKLFYSNYKNYMIENELVIPAGKLVLNLASPTQRLTMFKWFDDTIDSTDKEHIEERLLVHPIFGTFKDYQSQYSLTSKYGLKYLDHIEADGRIRTRFNTVLKTGRLSASGPNVMQVPKYQRYRDAFIAAPGTKIVGADWDGQEMVLIAILTREQSWLNAMKAGKDVHSINSKMIFGKEWDNGTESDCEFNKTSQKCKCLKHMELRTKSKSVSFGITYGLTAHGLAYDLNITKKEAEDIIDKFYTAFPNIKTALMRYALFGVNNLYIIEPITGRHRFHNKKRLFIQGEKESMMRQSKNFPFQAAGASLLKITGVLLRRWIKHNNYRDKIKLVFPQHDEWVIQVDENLAELVAKKLPYFMQLAGKISLGTDLLTAQSYISDHWVK